MSDEEDEGPVVELGAGASVEGAPFTRFSARLHYGIEKSEVRRRIGEETIRTPDGPRTVADVLDEVEEPYFPTRQDLENAVREVIGWGPVPAGDADETDEE